MKHIVRIALLVWCIALPEVSWAGFDEGLAAFNKGDYATALQEWQPLAEQGNAAAQNSLGVLYEEANGVTKSYSKAVKWYTKAAEQGHEAAQFNLGRMYSKGRGVKQSDVAAVKWYTKAAEQGNAAAQNNLGLANANGHGAKKNDIEAVKWYTKAAEQGHAGSQFNLGMMYAQGRGVKTSDVEAVKWFTKAAEQGHVGAQSNLGWMYIHGRGVEKNNAEAAKWYAKAADQGDIDSQRWLGILHGESVGIEKNNSEAEKRNFKAAEQFLNNTEPGDVSAMHIRTSTTKQVIVAKAPRAPYAPKSRKIFRDCPRCPEMVVIPAGNFDMGSPDSEKRRGHDEGPVHSVKISAFAMDMTEITRGQFAEFVKKTKYSTGDKCWTLEKGDYKEHTGSWREPGFPQDDKQPVTCINWNDAQAYAKWLSSKTGKKYRLPTEAEWEYAARGNTSTARYWGDNPDEACTYANTADKTAVATIEGATSWSIHNCTDSFAYTAPVRRFKANPFGLYDMLGNVWEWTEDNYHDNYHGAPTDGSTWQGGGTERVLRGGSWNNSPWDVRADTRYKSEAEVRFSSFGFRVVRSLK